MPYTIFHIDSERGFRGGERQVAYLALWLKVHGHRNVVVCRAGDGLERAARDRGLEILTLPFLTAWDPVSALMLRRRVLAASGTPVLHAHTGHAAALAWLGSRGTRAKRVAHRRVAFPVTGGLSTRLKYSSADRVIALTEAVKRELVGGGVPAEKVEVIPSAIEPNVLERQKEIPRDGCRQVYSSELGLDWDADWVGSVCALDRSKGVDTLLRAARRVLDSRPKTAFLIAGDGRDRARLERLAWSLGINTKVRFMGQRSDNLQILKAIDVFVLPSLSEGMGSVLLEAAACGAPIIATRVGGIPEVVSDGENGLLYPPGDSQALAAALLRLLDDRELAKRLAAEGARRLDRFSVDKMGRATEKVYDGLMRGGA